MPSALEQVAVVTVRAAHRRPSHAPVLRTHRGHVEAFDHRVLAPSQLAHVGETERPDQIAASAARDHYRALGQRAQRGQVEMIHVRVGDQNDVEVLQLRRRKRRRGLPMRSDGQQRSDRKSDAIEQRRVAEHAHAVPVHQQCRMAEVCDSQRAIGPCRRMQLAAGRRSVLIRTRFRNQFAHRDRDQCQRGDSYHDPRQLPRHFPHSPSQHR